MDLRLRHSSLTLVRCLLLSLIWSCWGHAIAGPVPTLQAISNPVESQGDSTLRKRNGDFERRWTFRGDGRTPGEIKKAGGFWPTARSPSHKSLSLYSHVRGALSDHSRDTAYVSTSRSFSVAMSFAWPLNGYIYRIHQAENMVHVNSALRGYSIFKHETELASFGGMEWSQVHGWIKISDLFGKSSDPNLVSRDELRILLKLSFADLKRNLVYIENPDYDPLKWEHEYRTATYFKYSLAGFPRDHEAWEDEPWASLRDKSVVSASAKFLRDLGPAFAALPIHANFDSSLRTDEEDEASASTAAGILDDFEPEIDGIKEELASIERSLSSLSSPALTPEEEDQFLVSPPIHIK
ncbi:putative enterotoxin [Cordyceps sp. RAO-2017]|nr:putative enterotoxin [Cordyceps sp. RAO-2017]